ncbi:hypothetical protein C0993_000977 [Termitomyces sp. T159_Od127]|nr:hypothetical protein C0993_000977 [Termitomyces sp. T159_Od127]
MSLFAKPPYYQLFSSLDNPKSTHIDEVSVMNAFNVFDRKGELCRNYNCCDTHLPDLHALLKHFEDVHILVDPAAQAQITIPFNLQPVNALQPPFEPDDMELELDLDNSTQPPPQPVSSHSLPSSSNSPQTPNNPVLAHFAHTYPQFQHHSPYPSAHTSPYTSQPPSPGSTPQVHFSNATPTPVMFHSKDVFNAYACFSADYSSHMPGTQLNASNGEELHVNTQSDFAASPTCAYIPQLPPTIPQQQSPGQHCIPPALLFASASSQSPPPPPTNKLKLKVHGSSQAVPASTPATPLTTNSLTPFDASTTPSTVPNTPLTSTPSHMLSYTHLPPPLLLLFKPFHCPKPNCNKSYKHANGLKYHMIHGSCNSAPLKDLKHDKDLPKCKHHECKVHSLVCSYSVGNCQCQYKNMYLRNNRKGCCFSSGSVVDNVSSMRSQSSALHCKHCCELMHWHIIAQ